MSAKRYFKTVKSLTVLAALALAIMLGQTSAARANDYVVSNTADSGTGSLRAAIDQANSTAEDDTITFDPGVFATHQTINLNTRYVGLVISASGGKLKINGPASGVTLSLANIGQHFMLNDAGANLEISKLTLTGGDGHNGGSIYNQGTLKIVDSTITGNSASTGGGIFNNDSGRLTLQNSTVSGNSSFGSGGGIYSRGMITIINSTISGNSAGNTGGGINNSGGGTFLNVTVSGNSASGNSAPQKDGGGIFNDSVTSATTLDNTIIANNSGGNCNNDNVPTTVNARNSLIQDSLACVNGTNWNSLTGDPNLGPLADNGGPTLTHALLYGSIAIDAGDNAFTPTGTDQRGQPRIFGGSVDIGSYELHEYRVNSVNDPGTNGCNEAECTLREAIATALWNSGESTITFDPGVFAAHQTINLDSGLVIAGNGNKLTINGPAAGVTLSLANSTDSNRRHFTINDAAVNLEISRLTLTGGFGGDAGGAIYNIGTVRIIDSTVSGNSATTGGGIFNYSSGTLTIQNSTVSGNSATTGGGIFNYSSGTLTIQNSTVSGNSAQQKGGGIFNHSSGTLTIQNSTVSGNSAQQNGGGIYHGSTGNLTLQNSTISNNASKLGGGIISDNAGATTTLSNTIVANSTSGGDCYQVTGTISAQYSLIEDGLGCVNGTNTNNHTGDPDLGPLADNGGPTMTHALLNDSIAVDRGSNALIPAGITTDQRGLARIFGNSVDIGAYEFQEAPHYHIPVNSAGDAGTDGCNAAECTLREAIMEASATAEDDTITFDPGVFAAHQTISLDSGFEIPAGGGKLTINGPAAGVTLSLANSPNYYRLHFTLNDTGANLEISKLTLTGGVGYDAAGAIYSKGTVRIVDSTITGNSVAGNGGGIQNLNGRVTIQNSTVSGNTANHGGGLYNSGTMTIQNSTVSGNTANHGGGLYNSGTMTIQNSTVSGNTANYEGGGIKNNDGTITLTNTIVANSTSGGDCVNFASDGSTVSTDASYSLIEDGLGCVTGTNTNNLTGDPSLGPLADNGGPTMTHALLPGSIAIDAGNNALIPEGVTTDQRGLARISGARVDIGSYEYFSLTSTPPASVGGQVTDGRRGLNKAVLTLQAPDGSVKTVLTDPHGRFEFSDVPTGSTYVISVTAKHYQFAPQTLFVNANIGDLLFVGTRTTGGQPN